MQNITHIKLIALDLDGTLLNSQHQITDRARKAINAAQALGVRVLLATGKTYYSARQLVSELKLTTPSVFVQGTLIYNPDGTIRHQVTLPPDVMRRIIPFAESRGACVSAYSGESVLLRRPDPRADLTRYHEPEPTVVGSLINAMNTYPINKLIIATDGPNQTKAMLWQAQQMLGTSVTLTMSAVQNQFEILPRDVSKGRAVASVARELGIDLSHVMAIGDAENDREMLELVGMGIAMGNAPERLKAVARYVTTSNDEDGVAEALEKFVLPKPAPIETAAPVAADDKMDEDEDDA
ncbi:Cof-type HAD-IIB family hydrolase [Aggregatilineales bacterium SYSU G02658]